MGAINKMFGGKLITTKLLKYVNAVLKSEEIRMSDYTKFKEIYDEIDSLIENEVDSSTPEFQAWYNKTKRFLIKKFGDKSHELKEFENHRFCFGVYSLDDDNNYEDIKACQRDLRIVKAVFADYLKDMKEESEEDVKEDKNGKRAKQVNKFDKVFIVHGHNGELKEATARLIEHQGIKSIILHEQVNRGATIIEKIESNSDVQSAICLFTADDLGKGKAEQKENLRARQNVIFETGYFIGKLGRENTIIISDRNIEIPSDLQGIVYADTSDWKLTVLKELKAIGYNIDYNKID